MLILLVYILLTIVLLTVFGFGLTAIIFPKINKPHILLLSPWIAIIVIIFFGVFFGLAGLTVNQWAKPLSIFLAVLSLYKWQQTYYRERLISRRYILIALIVLATIIFNLSPLFIKYKFLTTLSMGNNDAQAYSLVPDYLKDHSLKYCLHNEVPKAVEILIPFGSRWGPPVITAFFLTLFSLQGYQFITIFQAVLFALALPLLLILWQLLYPKLRIGEWISVLLVALNVNLLYFLYHNFFSQTLFLGFNLFFIILLVMYPPRHKSFFTLNRQELMYAITLTVLFFSYSEAVLFILIPMSLIVLTMILRPHLFFIFLFSYTRIFILTFIFGFFSITHAFNFITGYRVQDFYNPIGWQVFRTRLPYPNPFEAMGFWSIHSFPPLFMPLAIGLSLLVVFLIIKGILATKHRLTITVFLVSYLSFIAVFAFFKPNFWYYNRAIVYAIPLMTVIFGGGLVVIFRNKLKHTVFFGLILIFVAGFNAIKLNRKFLSVHLAVDKPLVSLQNLMPIISGNTVFSQNVTRPAQPVWDELWQEYFLEPEIDFINSQEFQKQNIHLTDDDYILLSKTNRYTPRLNLLLTNKIWESRNFVIGQTCQNDDCLLKSSQDLSAIIVGKTEGEDSLIGSGWEARDADSRWTSSSSATLKLINKEPATYFTFTARSLASPQNLTIKIDNIQSIQIGLSDQWQTYKAVIPSEVAPGLHHIQLTFSHLYRPIDRFETDDSRTLTGDFKQIKLE
jgi:hypothetical protein